MDQSTNLTFTYEQAHDPENIAAFGRGLDAVIAALSLGSVKIAQAAIMDLFACPTVIDERADMLGDAHDALERGDTRQAVSLLHRVRTAQTQDEKRTGWTLPQ